MTISKGKQAAIATIDSPKTITAIRIKVEDEVSFTEVDAHPSSSLRNL